MGLGKINLSSIIMACALVLGFSRLDPVSESLLGIIALISISYRFERGWTHFEQFLVFSVGHATVFFWVGEVVTRFTNWPSSIGFICWLIVGVWGGAWGALCGWFTELLSSNSKIRNLGLSFPAAWGLATAFVPRPFEWMIGHLLLHVPGMSSFVAWGGLWFLDVCAIWLVTILVSTHTSWRLKVTAPIIFLVFWLSGLARETKVKDIFSKNPTLRVMMVQGKIAPMRRGEISKYIESRNHYVELTKLGLAQCAPDLIVWPESAIITERQSGWSSGQSVLHQLGQDFSAPLMFGSQVHRLGRVENLAMMFDPQARQTLIYSKLVPFPLAEKSSSIEDGAPQSTFGIERKSDIFPLSAHAGARSTKVLPLICYESILDWFVRERVVRNNPDLLVEISNHNWFGSSLVKIQHQMLAIPQAIENGVPLVRVSNAGFSSVVMPWGESVAESPSGQTNVGCYDIPTGRVDTLYSQGGYLLRPIAGAFFGILVCAGVISRYKRGNLRLDLSRFKVKYKRPSKALQLLTATALFISGILATLGYFINSNSFIYLSRLTGASVYPFVFNQFKGIDYWALRYEVVVTTIDAKSQRIEITPEMFSRLPGPHHFHAALMIPFAFAPVYPEEWWQPPIRAAFCENIMPKPPLANLLNLSTKVASVKLVLSTRNPDDHRSWEFRVKCDGASNP